MNYFFAVVGVAIALTGAFLNTQGKWQGFLFWLASNAWWCGYHIFKGEYIQAFLFGVFWLLSLYGIFQWRKTRRDFEKQLEQVAVNTRELTNKEISNLLHQNTAMHNFIESNKFHKKAKNKLMKKLRITEAK